MSNSEAEEAWYRGAVALVTGAPGRLGRAIALRLASLGMHVAVHYHRSEAGAVETADLARAAGVEAAVFQADLSAGAECCEELIASVSAQLGTPSVMINNASVFESATLESLTEEAWDRAIRVNLQAPLFLVQAVARRLGERRGHLIQLLDWRADNPIPGHLAYTISKAGLAAMTRLLAQELGPSIQVNGVAPGAILPPPGVGKEHLDVIVERLPLRRPGSEVAITRAVEYLLDADFVTGEVLHVTGGQQLGAY